MSYLLTEIALEMLGYKFYDIYGVQDEINNFQNMANAERSCNPHHANEPNLAALLGLLPGASSVDLKESRRSANKSVPADKEADIPNALARVMDIECGKVRQQVLRNKPTPLAAEGQLDGQTAKTMANNFVEVEREKLRVEQQTLKTFRRHIEQVLIQMNPNNFEKYCESFKTERKALKRTTDGAVRK